MWIETFTAFFRAFAVGMSGIELAQTVTFVRCNKTSAWRALSEGVAANDTPYEPEPL
jgi:hypothetical protein